MIPITVPKGTNTPLVFSVDDIRRLRDLGVCGILSGTLPAASQQNVFLGVPLTLLPEEAVWLIAQGLAYLVDNSAFPNETTLSPKQLSAIEHSKQAEYEKQYAEKVEEHRLKMLAMGKPFVVNEQLIRASLTVEIPNDTQLNQPHAICSVDDALRMLHVTRAKYNAYSEMRRKGYMLSPGGRFGGDWVCYPGDPLRYHAHLTCSVLDKPIDLLHLVNAGRLASGVKKLWVLADHDAEFVSVEWAGFG